MVSKGKVSPRSSVKPLSNKQVSILTSKYECVDPTRNDPIGRNHPCVEEIKAQNPKMTKLLLNTMSWVMRTRGKYYAWGLENIPEEGAFITAATHVTMFDVFVPMVALFHMGRRPRFMAKAELTRWPILGKFFQIVGVQPVERRSGKARAIENTSIDILCSGRPLTIWPEGTVTRDPQKWVMSVKNGVGVIALEASRRLGKQVPLYCAVTWGAASINHWLPWPRKNVMLHYDMQLDYSDLLASQDSWGEHVPQELATQLGIRVQQRMNALMSEIRNEPLPDGYWDYRLSKRVKYV
ncbi:MAG: lysophospholipid acyltransferase family protein [Bifidobacteriaceae bacterium]|nr:lysophospholipid acyltransferase family protein [Bifidobacteriaceae bacterium]